MLNTFKLHPRRIWLFAAHRDALNPLSIVNSTVTKIQSKPWTHFSTVTTLKTSQTQSFNHRQHCRGWKYSPAPGLPWSITLLSHGNATLRVALRWTYRSIPTTRLRRVKSTNIASVGSRRRVWRHTMPTCWMMKTPLCVSQTSKTGLMSRRSWLPCQMIWLSGSANYILCSIWDGMSMTNALSNAQVETSSKAWDSWCGIHTTRSISYSPISGAITTLRPQNTFLPKCTLRIGGGRHR